MKDRIEVRFTIATDSFVGKETSKAVGKAINVVAKRYATQIDRLVEAFVKDLESEGGQEDGKADKK